MEDRLTELPDSILSHILSFLPTLQAVQTLLLRRFNTLWTSLETLDFDDGSHPWPEGQEINTSFFQFVHNVLSLHDRPSIEKFRVNIQTILYEDIESEIWRREIDSWLIFAVNKQVKVLELEFSMVEPVFELYKLPFQEFVSDSIVEIKLFFIELKNPIRFRLNSLRILKLIYMELSDEAFSEVIRGCPNLKELELSNCNGLIEVNSSNLERIKIDRECINWEEIMRINCPKLRLFEYNGCLDGLEIVNSSSLIQLSLGYLYFTEQQFKHFTHFQSLFKKLLNAKRVAVSSEYVQAIFYCTQKYLPSTMVNWTQMELSIWLTMKNINCFCHLLKNSPCLEKLVLKFSFWESDLVKAIESEIDTNGHDHEEYNWSSLKTIIIHNIPKSSYALSVRLIEVLLKSSPTLDRMVIYKTTEHKLSEASVCPMKSDQLTELSAKLTTFTKASKTAKVLLL